MVPNLRPTSNNRIRQLHNDKINIAALLINELEWRLLLNLCVDYIVDFSECIDPLIQFKAYIKFGINAPGYGPLINKTVAQQVTQNYYMDGGCRDQTLSCYSFGDNQTVNGDNVCFLAISYCVSHFHISYESLIWLHASFSI